MTFSLSRFKTLSLCLALVLAMPLAAAPKKRRAIAHPSNPEFITASVNGTVLDATTGLPIVAATVTLGDQSTSTTAAGVFQINNVRLSGTSATVTAARSGYESATQNVGSSGTHTLTFRLTPKATTSVRLTNGTTYQIDTDSVKFGYVLDFGNYVAFDNEDFCKSDGTFVRYNLSQIKRVTGPATAVTQSNCCPRPVLKVRVELRTGDAGDHFFADSCSVPSVDLIGRDHASGQIRFIKFSDIAEVVFP